jgi:transglutaminase-like putative cysteine protease
VKKPRTDAGGQILWEGSRILRRTVIPSKRRVLGREDVLIPTDLRQWISPADSGEIKAVIAKLQLPEDKIKGSFDRRARAAWKYVVENIEYAPDRDAQRGLDFWQFPAETIALGAGDCEDCAFLLASLLLASGISPYCVRAVLGVVIDEHRSSVAHAWPIYKDESGQWRVLESTLGKLPADWPLADRMADAKAAPRYVPDICFNPHHVWRIGRRRIENAASYVASLERGGGRPAARR